MQQKLQLKRVIGGGAAIIKAASSIDSMDLPHDQKIGCEIILRAVKAPMKQIATNAGYDAGVVVNTIEVSDNANLGFDAASGEYVDMFEKGIIDPLKVERVALTNAISVAGMLLTTEASIIDIKEPTPPAPPADMGGGMPGMPGMM